VYFIDNLDFLIRYLNDKSRVLSRTCDNNMLLLLLLLQLLIQLQVLLGHVLLLDLVLAAGGESGRL